MTGWIERAEDLERLDKQWFGEEVFKQALFTLTQIV